MAVVVTLLVVWLIITGKCSRLSSAVKSGQRRDVSDSATLVSDSDTRYEAM